MKIRLKEILENQNKTTYSLSKEIGVTQNNLSKIIKGETTSIKYDILEKLCISLKITPNDIFQIEADNSGLLNSSDSVIHESYSKEEKTFKNTEISNSKPLNNIEEENDLLKQKIELTIQKQIDKAVYNVLEEKMSKYIYDIILNMFNENQNNNIIVQVKQPLSDKDIDQKIKIKNDVIEKLKISKVEQKD